MTGHPQPEFRAIAAETLEKGNDAVTYRNGRSAGDLVRAIASSEMFSYPLRFGSNRDGHVNDDTQYMCFNWRFLVHVEGHPRGLQIVEGGLTHTEWSDADLALAPLEVEISFDQTIDGSADTMVQGLIDYVGDEILEKSYENDRPFFACLEHRYGNGEGWPQLVYPPELRKTVEAVQRRNAARLKSGHRPNKWMERAAKSGATNRTKSANAMAMSAFWHIKQSDENR